jgi:pimeloyl-ACP methyl ester carboxylesterase
MPKHLTLTMPAPRDIAVLGHRIRYWDEGQGDPLVLVHGFSGSATYEWAPVFAPLAQHRRVVALQVIGFDPSEQPDIVYSTDALVSHLGELMRALKLENITLLGESFGGWHVAAYATRAAALGLPPIAKLVLVGGAICVKQPPPPGASGFVDPEWETASAAFALSLPASYEAARMAILRDSGLVRREPTRDELAQISVPTLLLWGEKDALIPLDCGQDAATLIPNAELVVLPNVGHIPSIEATDDFIRIVGAFADR